MSDKKTAQYQSYPDLEPYASHEGYEHMKEDFKTIVARLESLLDVKEGCHVIDLGCGNGALLNHLHRLYPHWSLTGVDSTLAFIETARAYPGLKGVSLLHGDFFQAQGSFDVVLSTCLLSIFKDVREPLQKMLDLCRPGGLVMGTGLFNPFDIEVRVEFCDNTHPKTHGRWRTDFNRHSRKSIRSMFGHWVQWIEFEECPFNVEVDHDPANPIRVWTVGDAGGGSLLINGAYQICNQTLLIMKK